MEVEGVEAGAQVAALFIVPDEGRAVVAEVAGGGVAESAVVAGRGDDGEFLDDV